MTRIGTITHEDFLKSPAWRSKDFPCDDSDPEVVPLGTRVPASVWAVWCLADITFADGSKWLGSVHCFGNDGKPPGPPVVWNGPAHVHLYTPPVPAAVLALDGPEPFAKKLGKTMEEVFPITCVARAEFEPPPTRRGVVLYADGTK